MVKTCLITRNTGINLVTAAFTGFKTNSASASIGRAIEIIVSLSEDRTYSAISGVLIRLDVISGSFTSPFSFSVTQVNAARGTLVAMVGIRASCHPIPVLIIVAPAFQFL